jgi:uncharacterized protein YjbJ (UPF0337 family)
VAKECDRGVTANDPTAVRSRAQPFVVVTDVNPSADRSWTRAGSEVAPRSAVSKRIHEIVRNQMGEIIDKVKGKIEQVAGVVTGDKKLERDGKIDEASGKVKGAVEDVKHAVKDTLKKP